MKTKFFFRRKAAPCKSISFSILLAMLLAGTPSSQARSVNLDDYLDVFQSAQNHLMESLMHYRTASPADALTCVQNAQGDLQTLRDWLLEPASIELIGKPHKALTARVNKCIQTTGGLEAMLDPESGVKPKPAATMLKSMANAAKLTQASEQAITKPLFSGKGGQVGKPTIAYWGDIFNLKAGQLVTYELYPPGYPAVTTWDEEPEITLRNGFGGDELDTSFEPRLGWKKKGTSMVRTVTVKMGSREGYGGSIDVSYKGVTATRFVWNRGGSSAASLPYGFPSSLQSGNYQMGIGYSAQAWITGADGKHYSSIGPVTLPGYTLPTIPMKNLKAFANLIVKQFNQIAPAMVTSGANITSVVASCTASTDNSVTLSFVARYGDAANGGIATVTLTLTRL